MPVTPLHDLIAGALTAKVKDKARGVGFDLVGIAPAEPSQHSAFFRKWLDEGHAGTMTYLKNRVEERTDPATYLPGARSVICVAMNYYAPLDRPAESEGKFSGRIARYALGNDYHEIIKQRLYDLADWLRDAVPGTKTRAAVDTAPVMERELAARAGIGWVGKNTCVIHPELGSWILLGEVLTTLELTPDEPMADHCGTCRRCIDACPTGAITEPYQLDARRCISYLTIEHRGPIPAEFQPQIGDWLYGCDICQDVCPHNHKPVAAPDPLLLPRFPTGTLDARDVSQWDDETYRARLRHSAMKRVKLPVLRDHAQIVVANTHASKSELFTVEFEEERGED